MPQEGQPDVQSVLARVGELESQLAAAIAEIARKDQIIAGLQQRLFGKSSERLDPNQIELGFDEETLGKPEPLAEDGGEAPAAEGDGAGRNRTRRKKADLFPKNLLVVIDEVIIPDEVAADPDAFEEIGEEYHDELDVTSASMFWRRKVRKKFVSRTDRNLPPVMAPAPEPSLPGTLCAPGLAAQIITDKYCDHLPHHRQSVRIFRQHNAQIGRATLNAWTHAAAAHLALIGVAILHELFMARYLQVDETPIDYLCPGNGKTKQGYLWVYLDAVRGTVYYDWQLGRGHDCLLDIIGVDEETGTTDFRGKIQCDGYSAYQAVVNRYGGIELGGCLAHIRRKFVECRQQAPGATGRILAEIQKLYRIEEQLRLSDAPPPCRKLVRLARARPIVAELKGLILTEKTKGHLPKSKLGEALAYALGQWEKFETYLYDGEQEIDNNLVENAIRPTKLGAKNYMFFGSAAAGKGNALLYTLIENCKRQGLDPEKYLAEVIRRLPANATAEQAAELTPAKIAAAARLAEAAA